jgi:hypothetical protein
VGDFQDGHRKPSRADCVLEVEQRHRAVASRRARIERTTQRARLPVPLRELRVIAGPNVGIELSLPWPTFMSWQIGAS